MSLSSRHLAGAILVAVAAPVMAQAQEAGVAPIQALDDGLLAIMKGGKSLGFAGRAARIAPVVDQAFDLPLMTRLSVGPAWTGMSATDQAALSAAFRRMTIAQYADNFDGWSGESFVIDPKVEVRGTDRLVKTTLKSPHDAPVSLAYRLRQTGGSWRIIDVFYKNSISQLATRRSDFARILSTGGAKALVTHLNALSEKAAR
ncbi:ABC transporter substrate-binding protein [Sphingomonas sp. AR_OL41]|uniref:ABC transporter substrate-binding protein n=1 Tax=Sphingomonas sp. AR_OL41 TaxID=3042729 RepID=UPI00247FD16D|nr:ABC transporter substrate-binding protein [Sphingomonas sp. AR_OL41]MDH7974700.1 ABC transporter substrate-binding protein [Sphingomonas sp. AR_OL41]